MRRVPTTNERERNAAFLHGFQGDTYIDAIFGEKVLHPVFLGLREMQLFMETLPRRPQYPMFLLFVCRRFAPLEQINTLHILTIKIKTMKK